MIRICCCTEMLALKHKNASSVRESWHQSDYIPPICGISIFLVSIPEGILESDCTVIGVRGIGRWLA